MTNPNNGQFPAAGAAAPATLGFGAVPPFAQFIDTSNNNALWVFVNGVWIQTNNGLGSGNVVGPAGATNNDFCMFSGATGLVIKDNSTSLSTDGTLAGNSDSLIPSQKAVKTYVDAVAAGLDVRGSVLLATTAALAANTYANGASGVGATLTANGNGALSIDGVATTNGDRVLIKNEVAAANNGIYVVTDTGGVGTPYILTRATDYNSAANITAGSFTFCEQGTVNANGGFVMVPGATPIVVGTTALNWTQFSGAGEITAGTGLTKAGNTLSITATGVAVAAYIGADITVNAQGQATAIATGSGARKRIAALTPSGTNTVQVAAIDQSFTHIEIEYAVRSTTAGTGVEDLVMKINADATAANYVTQSIFANLATAQAGQVTADAGCRIGQVPTAGDFAGAACVGKVTIPFYTATTFNKHSIQNYGTVTGAAKTTLFSLTERSQWANAAAITQLDFTITGNFVAGSQINVYLVN